MNKRGRWSASSVIKAVFTAVALVFLIRLTLKYGQEIPTDRLIGMWPALLVALSVLVLLRVYQAFLWGRVLLALGGSLRLRTALSIHTRALLARYIPGNVWHGLGITYWCQQEGVPARTSVASWILENVYTVLGGALAATVTAPWWLVGEALAQFATLCITIPIGLLMVHPRVLPLLLSAPLRLLKRPPLQVSLSFARSVSFAWLYVLLFLGQGWVLGLLTGWIEPGHTLNPLTLAGIFATAWTVGFLSFITPSGIGVREGVMSLMLARVLPVGSAMLLPILMRILMTLAEVVAAAIPFGAGVKSAATVDAVTENLSSARSKQ